MIRFTVLSLSLLTVMSGAAVAPAVADIMAYFPDASELLGKMVLTTPALTIIPVALLKRTAGRYPSCNPGKKNTDQNCYYSSRPRLKKGRI